MLEEGRTYKGRGTYKLLGKEYETNFEIEQIGIRWYIYGVEVSFEYKHPKKSTTLTIKGDLEDNTIPIFIIISEDRNIRGNVLEAEVDELKIGEVDNLTQVSTQLYGVYLSSKISFNSGDIKIQIQPTSTSIKDAKKVFRGNGCISKGNILTIEGDNLEIEQVNNIIGKVCILLTSISFSNVVFGHLNINEDEGIVIPKKKMKYTSDISFSYAVMDSTPNLEEFFKEAFPKYLSLSKELESIVFNISYALMVSSSTLYQESRMFELISCFEGISKDLNLNKGYDEDYHALRKKEIKEIKPKLKEVLAEELKDSIFTEEEQKILSNNLNRLSYIQEQFKRTLTKHLKNKGWEINLNLEDIKEIRDSLAHSARFPKGFTAEQKHNYIISLQQILFITILDILEIDVMIQFHDQEGWRNFGKKELLKKC
ncbi:hypothetical protein MY04_4148 [Flammeovirga sp. MY04]|uniref:hypothetical protein n=1 Tax=Flammeovirga sp. MY04 TaxID=1191459 RepID=UPI0008060882|nr:hypothetical protein [Flammeovirga sp. MY04]ANQ51492.1 hypothetical protein MY04_4148 [Flammeovirga sp. MY04]